MTGLKKRKMSYGRIVDERTMSYSEAGPGNANFMEE